MDCTQKISIIPVYDVEQHLSKYFLKIKSYIEKHTDWYGNIELEYFNDILENIDLLKTKNYKKRFVVQEIRKSMAKK